MQIPGRKKSCHGRQDFGMLQYFSSNGQQLTNLQILGTAFLAFSAFDAVKFFGNLRDFLLAALGIHSRKQFRNGNSLGTYFRTVPAGSAGDQTLVPENSTDLFNSFQFFGVQGLEIFHEANIVLHLSDGAHTGQNIDYTFKTGCKPEGIAGVGATLQPVQNFLGSFRKVDERAALDGLHNENRLAVFAADFVALSGLDLIVLKIHIVKLDLNHFDFRVLGQNVVQNLGAVMERHAEMTNLAFLLQLQGNFKGIAALISLFVCVCPCC